MLNAGLLAVSSIDGLDVGRGFTSETVNDGIYSDSDDAPLQCSNEEQRRSECRLAASFKKLDQDRRWITRQDSVNPVEPGLGMARAD